VIMGVTSRSWSQIEGTGLVQRTQVQGVSEDVESVVSRLLDLEGLAVSTLCRQ